MTIHIYSKNTKSVDSCKNTNFKDHEIFESDIEKWILKNPFLIGDDILPITSQYDGFNNTNERLDILAVDSSGKLVIIEIKRDDSGSKADLQAIKYAAFCSNIPFELVTKLFIEHHNKQNDSKFSYEEAEKCLKQFLGPSFENFDRRPRIIIVATSFREEVTSSVYWLHSQYGMDISCVKLRPFIIDEERIGIETTTIIPVPEAKRFLMDYAQKEVETETIKRNIVRWTPELIKEEISSLHDSKLRESLITLFEWADDKGVYQEIRAQYPQFGLSDSYGKKFVIYLTGHIFAYMGKDHVDEFGGSIDRDEMVVELKRIGCLSDNKNPDENKGGANFIKKLSEFDNEGINDLLELFCKVLEFD